MSKLAKLVQLFAEGIEVPIPTPSGEAVLLWVHKLNPFQEETANMAGRIARSRTMLAVKKVGTPEYELFQANLLNLTDEAIVAAILDNKSGELLVRADREMRFSEEWRERMELLEHNGEDAERPEEAELLAQVGQEVAEELRRRHLALEGDVRSELRGLSSQDLREHYSDAHLDSIGLNAFAKERQRQQVFLSLRECEGVLEDGANARYDHSSCDHTKLYLDDVDEVTQLPPLVWQRVTEAYQDLMLSPTLARFTDALTSSSDSPEPSVSEEESTPSGPVEMPAEQEAISSSP